MARLFGFFTPNLDATRSEANARYARAQVGRIPEVENGPIDTYSVTRTNACCYGPRAAEVDGIVVTVGGEPIWRGERIPTSDSKKVLTQLADRYRSSGQEFLAELEGPFVISILDPGKRHALLAIDRMGIERLTYVEHSGGLVFGTSAHAVAGFPGISCPLRDQALYDFLIFHMVPAPKTAYRDVRKLAPATALVFDNGVVRLNRYWEPNYTYAKQSDFEELKGELHSKLQTAIRACGVEGPTGAFLSGGLDSSSITGALAGISELPTKTFTVGFGETEYDELRFSRIANEHFGCMAFEYQMTPGDIVDAFPRIAAAYDEPFGNSSAVPTYFCAKLAADNGITHLLAGDGGDEIFGGNERYVRQRVFEFYKKIPRWLRKTALEPATRAISPESNITPLRKIRSYVDQALIPLPERFESWNLIYREGSERMLTAEFANAVDKDGPFEVMRDVWNASPSEDLLERMLWYDWHFTLADNDLRKVGTMCDLAGVRVSYPLLQDSVVTLSNRIPPSMKIRRSELRSFFKNAMSGFLPQEILQKKKHGFGLPFGLWLKTDAELRELIYSNLSDLKKRQIITSEFIDDLIRQHQTGHASYFGYALWDLAILEAWLVAHSGNTI